MSAPNTNIEKQERRHKPALFGMGAAVAWSLGLLALLLVWLAWNGNEPDGAETQIDGRTGTVSTADEG